MLTLPRSLHMRVIENVKVTETGQLVYQHEICTWLFFSLEFPVFFTLFSCLLPLWVLPPTPHLTLAYSPPYKTETVSLEAQGRQRKFIYFVKLENQITALHST